LGGKLGGGSAGAQQVYPRGDCFGRQRPVQRVIFRGGAKGSKGQRGNKWKAEARGGGGGPKGAGARAETVGGVPAAAFLLLARRGGWSGAPRQTYHGLVPRAKRDGGGGLFRGWQGGASPGRPLPRHSPRTPTVAGGGRGGGGRRSLCALALGAIVFSPGLIARPCRYLRASGPRGAGGDQRLPRAPEAKHGRRGEQGGGCRARRRLQQRVRELGAQGLRKPGCRRRTWARRRAWSGNGGLENLRGGHRTRTPIGRPAGGIDGGEQTA